MGVYKEVEVEVDIDIDDVLDYIETASDRELDEISKHLSLYKETPPSINDIMIKSAYDQCKLELIIDNFDKVSLSELENFFANK